MDETYSQFSHKVARDVRIYGISDNNEIILAHLQQAMPEALSIGITVHNQITKGDSSDNELKSINEILKLLAYLPGPSKHKVAEN